MFPVKSMSILDTIVEQKNAKSRSCPRASSPPAIARCLLERGEQRDFFPPCITDHASRITLPASR